MRAPLKGATPGDGLLPLRDLDQLRAFLSGTGPSALFDLPWMPIYVAICFLFHPLIGVAAVAGAAILALLTYLTDRATREPSQTSTGHGLRRNGLAEAGRRNAEVLAAMGMQGRFAARWGVANRDYMAAQQQVADVAGGFGAGSKVFRMALQSGVLALGAWLVINNMASAGIIIASSILVARSLAPAELAIANWRGFVQARQSWARLSELFARIPAAGQPHALPAPSRSLSVEGVSISPPGAQRFVVQDVSFGLTAGQGLGIIGPSASGKSSLVRALVGVWPPLRGKVRIDGAALDQWSSADLGPHLGFLPQEVELFGGTVAENIARFDPDAASADSHRGGQGGGGPRPDPAALGGLRHPDRRGRRRAVGRAAPAGRPGPGALRRSVPRRARRAQRQPRQRGRERPDPGDPRGARSAAASASWSPTGRARSPPST